MLDAYVIEEIKRRGQRPADPEPERPSRGVVIIDLD